MFVAVLTGHREGVCVIVVDILMVVAVGMRYGYVNVFMEVFLRTD